MEWPIGIFSMMAIMAGLIGGTIGIRMIYIDDGYRKIIAHVVKKQETDNITRDNIKEESDLTNSRDSNRHGTTFDAFCMIGIIFVGMTTSLGIISDLLTSSIISGLLFVTSTIHFQHHAQKVLKNLH